MRAQIIENEGEMRKRIESIKLGQENQVRLLTDLEERVVNEMKQQGEMLSARMAEMITMTLSKQKNVVEEEASTSLPPRGISVQNVQLRSKNSNTIVSSTGNLQNETINNSPNFYTLEISKNQPNLMPVQPNTNIDTTSQNPSSSTFNRPNPIAHHANLMHNESTFTNPLQHGLFNINSINQNLNHVGINTRPHVPQVNTYQPSNHPYQYQPNSATSNQNYKIYHNLTNATITSHIPMQTLNPYVPPDQPLQTYPLNYQPESYYPPLNPALYPPQLQPRPNYINQQPQKIDLPCFNGENPRAWLYKCENFFTVYQVQERQKVCIASMYLIGWPKSWYQGMLTTRAGELT